MKKKPGHIILFVVLVSFLTLSIFSKETTRPYLKTGNWYPGTRRDLSSMLNSFFKEAGKRESPSKIKAIIAPHAGYYYSGKCAAGAYAYLKHQPKIDRVFILGVAHRARITGGCVSDYSHNSTPLGKIPVDTQVTRKLSREKHFTSNNEIMLYEHSIENQLPFIQTVLKGRTYKIVPVLLGRFSRTAFGEIAQVLKKYLTDHSLVVASTDFTHYGENFGYAPFKGEDVKTSLTKLDQGMIDTIRGHDFDRFYEYKRKTGITMCGFGPVGILLKLFPGETVTFKLVDYYKSGDANNDYSMSVSYASLIGIEKKSPPKNQKLSHKDQQILLQLARKSLDHYFKHRKIPQPSQLNIPLSSGLTAERGVFVTLKDGENLRGCIGYIQGIAPLAKAVIENTLNAALRDPRFYPVKKDELPHLTISISVMTPLQKITDYRKIRLGTDGVLIRQGGHQGVFLPQVATETGWNLDQFLDRLSVKAGMGRNGYKKKEVEFFIFQAQVFSEKNHR